MFMLFLLAVAAIVYLVVATTLHPDGGAAMRLAPSFVIYAWALAGLFAMVYLSLRWRIIVSRENPFAVIGLIGAFGLIAMLVVVLAILTVGLATGAWPPHHR